jgi:hypothetical protein
MNNKQKHLEFIQTVVSRMANNSFLLKGWSITLIAALFVLGAKDANKFFITLAYFPTILFWFLDGYFLQQERLYRALYDSVRKKEENDIDFSMNAHGFISSDPKNTWISSTFLSKTVGASYFALVVIMALTIFLIF